MKRLAEAESEKVGERHGGVARPEAVSRVDANAVRSQLDRILAHPLFTCSKRYTNLLRYIVDRSLAVQHDDLRERIVGIEVFGRTPNYDTNADSTVRVSAAEVRKRLSLYYSEPGHEQELRIEVPVGSYIGEFRPPEQKRLLPDILPLSKRRTFHSWRFVVPLVLVVLTFGGWKLQRLLMPVSAIDKFWTPLLDSSKPIVLCFDAPPSVPLTSATPSNSNSSSEAGVPLREFIERRAQISISDVNAADEVATYLRQKRKDSILRPARNISMSDLRLSPVVIIGLIENEWVSSIEANLHFRIRREDGIGKEWIVDASNSANMKWMVDPSVPYEKVSSDYALISRVQDSSTGQWWIAISGLTSMGTQLAHRILIDPKAMEGISSGFPKDWEHKNLQIVLAIEMVQGSPVASRVAATYFW